MYSELLLIYTTVYCVSKHLQHENKDQNFILYGCLLPDILFHSNSHATLLPDLIPPTVRFSMVWLHDFPPTKNVNAAVEDCHPVW